MKKLIGVFTMMLVVLVVSAQNKQDFQYADVAIQFGATGKWKETKIDFGQTIVKNIPEKDEITKKIKALENGIDAVNLMDDYGWVYLDMQVIPMSWGSYYYVCF